jgi:hypothetical protein
MPIYLCICTYIFRHAEGDVKSAESELSALAKQQEILKNDIDENEILLQQQQQVYLFIYLCMAVCMYLYI